MKILLLLALTVGAFCQDLVHDMDAISKKIGDNLDKCWDASKGTGHPMPGGCGCDFPTEFCFWYEKTNEKTGLPEPDGGCFPLSDACKQAIGANGAAEGATAAPGATPAAGGAAGGAAGAATPAPSGGAAAGGGSDYHDYCCWWAQQGECDSNPFFMRPVCQKSCGTSGCTVNTATTCTVAVNTAGCKWGTGGTGGTSGAGAGSQVPGSSGAGAGGGGGDTHQFCAFWASVGECQKNAAWMDTGCCKSCQKC